MSVKLYQSNYRKIQYGNIKAWQIQKKVIETFSKYDVFLFPTKGENYGHVIFEALAGGCIPIISDQTPWNDIEQAGCGKVISLSNQRRYIETLQNMASQIMAV